MDDLTLILESTVRLATPLLFVALGELMAERAGALNISVEAMMLGGAYSAVLGSARAGTVVVGLLCGMAAGLVIAAMQANLSHRLRINQFVVGIVLIFLVLGLTNFLFEEVRATPRQADIVQIPGLASISVIGKALFAQRWPFYFIYALIPAVWWALYRSRWGLELRAVGENPAAATVTHIPVDRRRREAIYVCGLLSGFAGAHLSISLIGDFSPNMTAGRGWIAIAAVIFGGWGLWGTVGGCFLFGAAEALRLTLPAIGVTLNSQLLISAPFLLAILTMMLFARGKRQPAALGRTFNPEAP
jgi:simple sugar transport system permease protein